MTFQSNYFPGQNRVIPDSVILLICRILQTQPLIVHLLEYKIIVIIIAKMQQHSL